MFKCGVSLFHTDRNICVATTSIHRLEKIQEYQQKNYVPMHFESVVVIIPSLASILFHIVNVKMCFHRRYSFTSLSNKMATTSVFAYSNPPSTKTVTTTLSKGKMKNSINSNKLKSKIKRLTVRKNLKFFVNSKSSKTKHGPREFSLQRYT